MKLSGSVEYGVGECEYFHPASARWNESHFDPCPWPGSIKHLEKSAYLGEGAACEAVEFRLV